MRPFGTLLPNSEEWVDKLVIINKVTLYTEFILHLPFYVYIKVQIWGWESGPVNKILLLNHEDLSLDAQNTHKKPGTMCTLNSSTREVGTIGSLALTYQYALPIQ